MPGRKKSSTSSKKTKNSKADPESKKPRAGSKARKTQSVTDQQARAVLASSDKLYYRIGEVSELTGVKAHVLRYWETEFRWMAPPKSRAKQRLYRKRDIEFVWLLKNLLWDERYTIAGARQRIQDLGVDETMRLAQLPGVSAKRASEGSDGGAKVQMDAAETTRHETASPVPSRTSDSPDVGAIRSLLGELRGDLVDLRSELAQGL